MARTAPSPSGDSSSTSAGAYWPRPWTCEDGGPRRWGCATGQPGLGIRPGERLEVAAVRDAFATDVLLRREPGELYALRHDMPLRGPQSTPVEGWVERLDPDTLAVTASTPRLPGGAYWPGGIAAHASGDLHMVFGRWAHRLSPALDVLASHRLPVERPHNSFVVLDGGELVMKDCDAPAGREPSTVSVLDPETLLPVAAPLRLPEPSIARLSSDGESVIAVGTTVVFRLRLDRDAGRVVVDEQWRPRYGPAPERSYGWDPVLTDKHVFWMDNGRNSTDRTMLGSGEQAGPVRLWWARHDDGVARSVEISGMPYGTESNPPGWDPEGRIVVAYDAGNAVLRAWRVTGDDLEPLWRRDGFAHGGHLIVYPDTRELVAQDFADTPALRRPLVRRTLRPALQVLARSAAARRASLATGSDQLVVLDLDTGEDRARVAVPSPSQGFLFPAPGFGRDVYYQSPRSRGWRSGRSAARSGGGQVPSGTLAGWRPTEGDSMEASNATRILVVTDRVEATHGLLDTIRGRAARGPASFRILVPNPAPAEWHPRHPERHDKAAEAEKLLADVLPEIEEAAGHSVEGIVSTRHDPMDAIEETLHEEPFDEIILATTPHRIEAWLHVDLPHRVAHLGLPLTEVTMDHMPAADPPPAG